MRFKVQDVAERLQIEFDEVFEAEVDADLISAGVHQDCLSCFIARRIAYRKLLERQAGVTASATALAAREHAERTESSEQRRDATVAAIACEHESENHATLTVAITELQAAIEEQCHGFVPAAEAAGATDLPPDRLVCPLRLLAPQA